MWIRSQNKYQLVNLFQCQRIMVDVITEGGLIKYVYVNADTIRLGKYSSLDEAIKIVDIIQRLLEEPTYTNDVGGNEFAHYSKNVFQMPQDKEIEV